MLACLKLNHLHYRPVNFSVHYAGYRLGVLQEATALACAVRQQHNRRFGDGGRTGGHSRLVRTNPAVWRLLWFIGVGLPRV